MAKPTHDSLPPIAQEASKMFEGIVADLVARNPKMAMEDKLIGLAENAGAFKNHAQEMQVAGNEPVATQAVGDASKGPATGRT